MLYGGAAAGYRTMLDALIPASTLLKEVEINRVFFCFIYWKFSSNLEVAILTCLPMNWLIRVMFYLSNDKSQAQES